jgi:formate--tetrahydrofolate ligase
MLTDIEIAQSATLEPISDIAAKLDLSATEILPYGHDKAKIPLDVIRQREGNQGKLVLVTGINPTPAGEGKSTVSVGLADALQQQGRKVVLALREPSLGPVFGIKGGAAGGGYSQVVPMADINLHFTGDFHAITSAHSLLSAMLDNHLFRPNDLNIDHRQITWPRAVDMNDRALRSVVLGLGGRTGGIPREDGFVITAASEIMAIFGLASNIKDLRARLDQIIVGFTRDGQPVRAAGLNASGAMSLLLKDALNPNLVQTLNGTPAFVHGGPFANIAHGCNSLIATKSALTLGDVVITEAGFGADLGAEKFYDIKCRFGGLEPAATVIVATIRALKMHGGVAKTDLQGENVEALKAGLENLQGHVENMRKFGVPALVALNRFASDTDAEVACVLDACKDWGVEAVESDPHTQTGSGCLELASAVMEIVESGEASFKPLYSDDLGLPEKIETIATEIYGADGVDILPAARKTLDQLTEIGMGTAPVCIAKTQYSFSDNPALLGRPKNFRITVREVTPSAGAGFVVVKTGNVMTMPGLAAVPAATGMSIDDDGQILGLA